MISLPFENTVYRLNPTKIVCLGRNYVEHAREMGSDVPKSPVIFLKPPSSLLPPDSRIILPPESSEVHHEVELAVIIGKTGTHIRKEEAMQYVLGYTVFLDITARDLQKEAKKKGLPWTLSKGFDTFAPIGPRIISADELDPHALEIGLKVNGEVRQRSSTSMMIFGIGEIIAYVSSIMTLQEGDIIATGTPSGVGPIEDGDRIEAWIEGIGVLKEDVVST